MTTITNTRCFVDNQIQTGDFHIQNGALCRQPAGEVLDGRGKLLLPLAVDLAVKSHNLSADCQSASAAGIGQICIQPNSHAPVLDSASAMRAPESMGQSCRAHMLGASSQGLLGERLADMGSLKNAGCVALSDAGTPWQSYKTLRRALQYARSMGIALHLSPQDPQLSAGGAAHEGMACALLGLVGIPSCAESGALAMMLEIIRETGARVHINRISCARSVDLIARAKQDGLPISCDVAIANLVLTEQALLGYNNRCHVMPPLRTEADRIALIEGVNSGVIDAICSNHHPASMDDKLHPFASSAVGIGAMEQLLPLTLSLCFEKQNPLDLTAAVRALTTNPAYIIQSPVHGYALVDISQQQTVADHGRADNPFIGWQLTGHCQQIFV